MNSPSLKTVLEILKNEVDGDISAALTKLTPDYSMTWMYRGKAELFPRSSTDIENEMRNIYPIQNRTYEIKNTAEGQGVIMVELIERYPDPESRKMHETPLVLVLEMEGGKIKKGRHYCDPQLSYETIPAEALERAYTGTTTKKVIK